MLKIFPTIIKEDKEEIRLVTQFSYKNKTETLWYSFSKEYKEYLVSENSDAAVVSLLLFAMKNNEDIIIEGKISAKLFYQLNHYLIPALNLANKQWNKIKIIANELNEDNLNVLKSTGTGVSCGIDSFSTIYDHLNEKEIFNIDYLTFFNAGSHGDYGGERARGIFKERLNLVLPFVNDFSKKIVVIDTNLNEILCMNHQQTHTVRDVACILNLQKLFRYYYYASAFKFDYFKLNEIDTADYDLLILQMLSTESTTFYSAVSQFSRIERTYNVTRFTPSYKYLNVCVNHHNLDEVENCSFCSKCLRTQLTLELLGELDKYDKVFRLDVYKKYRDKYLAQIIAKRNDNIFNQEIYNLLLEKKVSIPVKTWIYTVYYKLRLNDILYKVKYLLKNN